MSTHGWSARRPAAVLVLLTVVTLTVVVGLATTGRPAAAASNQAPPTIQLVEQTNWLHAGDQFQVSVRVSDAPPGAELQLVVHERLQSRAQFRDTLDGDLGDVDVVLDRRPLTELGTDAGPFTTGFVVGGGGQRLPSRGVYPVEVRLVDAQGDELAGLVTYLAYLFDPDDTSYPPLAVAVVVEVSGPPALQPDGTIRMAPATVERARERADLLADAPSVPLTVAPQPETLDGLADSGRSGALTTEALVAATGDRPVLARPYTDVDLAALAQSGLIAEANDQADAGAQVVRSRFGREPVPGIWLSGATLGDDAAHQAVDVGIDRALLPPSAVEGQSGAAAGTVPDAPVTVNGGGPTAMVTDAQLATHLTGDDGPIDAQRFLAELAIMWFERPATPRAVAVHIPGEIPVDPTTVARALNGLTHGQAVRAVPLDQVFGVPADPDGPTTADLTAHELTDDLDGIARPLADARRDVQGADTIASGDGASLARSLLLATGSATPDDQRAAYVERVTDELGSLRAAVDLPDEFRITLTSRTSTIPVNITNSANQPLQVQIEFDSGQLEFPDGKVITEELQPGVTRLDVRVRTLTSGAFTLGLTVSSPGGALVLDQTTFDIRSTAVTGVGFVLSIGAGLFLAVWWARHWRNARRSRRLVAPGSVPASPSLADTAGGPPAGDAVRPDDTDDYQPAHMAGSRSRRS